MLGPEKEHGSREHHDDRGVSRPPRRFHAIPCATGGCLPHREARPSVQLVCLLRFLAGSLLGVAAGPARPGNVAIVAFGWTCCTMAIYLFNGVTDREEDVANASTRPIASGRLPVRSAVAAVGALTVTGLLCAFSAGTGSSLLAVVYLLIGYAYSGPPFPLKRTYYTCTGAGLGLGLAAYTAGFLAGDRRPDASLVIFAGAMTLWMGCVGGIAKEFSDVEGDRATAYLADGPRGAGARRLLAVVAGGIATYLYRRGTAVLVAADLVRRHRMCRSPRRHRYRPAGDAGQGPIVAQAALSRLHGHPNRGPPRPGRNPVNEKRTFCGNRQAIMRPTTRSDSLTTCPDRPITVTRRSATPSPVSCTGQSAAALPPSRSKTLTSARRRRGEKHGRKKRFR